MKDKEFKDHYRIRKGDIRIIFSFKNNELIIVNIKKIDFRGNVYKK